MVDGGYRVAERLPVEGLARAGTLYHVTVDLDGGERHCWIGIMQESEDDDAVGRRCAAIVARVLGAGSPATA